MPDINLFYHGYNCCQTVLASFAAGFGVPESLAFKIGAAFGGGMGRRGHVCGAVSGGLMVIGLKYSSSDPQDKQSKDLVYKRVQEFLDRFKLEHGSIYCRELLGRDFSIPGQYDLAHEEKLFDRTCPAFVEGAVIILSELFENS